MFQLHYYFSFYNLSHKESQLLLVMKYQISADRLMFTTQSNWIGCICISNHTHVCTLLLIHQSR